MKSHATAYITLVVCTAIALVGVFLQRESLGYHKKAADSVPQTSLNKIVQPNALFYTKVLLDRSKTFVSIPYRFEGQELQTIWLQLSMNKGETPFTRLMEHPVLHDISWNAVHKDHHILYQKNPTYKTFEDFLNNPPQNATVVISEELIVLPPFNQLKAEALTTTTNLEQVDYVITTYQPSRKEGQYYYYETQFDASKAEVNDKNELVWLMIAPDSTEEKPWYVGNIHVDFRQ